MLLVRAGCRIRSTWRCLSTQSASGALIHEVTPRDGLQNEKIVLSTDDKVELIRLIVASQPASIELTSFVRPDLVPAMADGEELVRRVSNEYEEWIESMKDIFSIKNSVQHFMALLPNLRAYETFQQLRKQDNCVLDTAVCLVRCVITILELFVRRIHATMFPRQNCQYQWYIWCWTSAYNVITCVLSQYAFICMCTRASIWTCTRDRAMPLVSQFC